MPIKYANVNSLIILFKIKKNNVGDPHGKIENG